MPDSTEGGTILDDLSVVPRPPGFDPGGFDCGEPDLTDYLCDGTAEADELAGFSCTYLVRLEDDLVGYFTVLADSIRLQTKERPKGVHYSTAPAIKLGRMGVDQKYRGNDIGIWILDFVVGLTRSISEEVGARYVTLDALKKQPLVEWYKAYGFVENAGEADREKAVRKWFKRWKSGDELSHVSMRFDVLLEGEIGDR